MKRLLAVRPTLKVLFMSGYPEDEVSRDGTLDPGVHFIRKPMSSEALLERLRAVLLA
jgi:FixJ family two-component response regulator